MAFCKNCGADIGDAKFCPHCGTAVEGSSGSSTTNTIMFGRVNITRPSSANGAINPINVSIDGQNVRSLKNGEECSVDLPYGIHTLEVSALMNKSITGQVLLDGQHTTSDWTTKFGLNGLVLEQSNPYSGSGYVSKPKKKNRGLLIALGVIIGLFVIIMAIGGSSRSNKSTQPADNNGTQSANSNSDGTKKASANTTEVRPAFKPVKGTLNNWEIIVNDFDYKKTISTGLITGYTASDGCQYCVVSLTVKNIGTESDVFLPIVVYGDKTEVTLIWGDYTYKRSELLFSEDSLTSSSMNPLVTSSGQIAFEIPDEVVKSGVPPVLVFKAGEEVRSCELKKE